MIARTDHAATCRAFDPARKSAGAKKGQTLRARRIAWNGVP
jgi:hypothetical protein